VDRGSREVNDDINDNEDNESGNYFLFPFDTNYFRDKYFGYKDSSNNDAELGSFDSDDKKPSEEKNIPEFNPDKYRDMWIAYKNFFNDGRQRIPFEIKKATDLNEIFKYIKHNNVIPMSDFVDKIAKKKNTEEEDLKINDINININLGFDTKKVENGLISALESLMDAVDGLLGFLYSRKDRRSEP
jgi:hypothetical protein